IVKTYRRRQHRDQRNRSALLLEHQDSATTDLHRRIESADLLLVFVQRLPTRFRTVFILAELEGMTCLEIAEGLGINPNTAHSRLREARRRMAAAVRRHLAFKGSVT